MKKLQQLVEKVRANWQPLLIGIVGTLAANGIISGQLQNWIVSMIGGTPPQ